MDFLFQLHKLPAHSTTCVFSLVSPCPFVSFTNSKDGHSQEKRVEPEFPLACLQRFFFPLLLLAQEPALMWRAVRGAEMLHTALLLTASAPPSLSASFVGSLAAIWHGPVINTHLSARGRDMQYHKTRTTTLPFTLLLAVRRLFSL